MAYTFENNKINTMKRQKGKGTVISAKSPDY